MLFFEEITYFPSDKYEEPNSDFAEDGDSSSNHDSNKPPSKSGLKAV
jgi:hypothetical protein